MQEENRIPLSIGTDNRIIKKISPPQTGQDLVTMNEKLAEAIYKYRIDPRFYCPLAPCIGESDVCGDYLAGCTGGRQ